MSRPIHWATKSLTACGLSLSFRAKIGGKWHDVGSGKPYRARVGDPIHTQNVNDVTCKNCHRAMRK